MTSILLGIGSCSGCLNQQQESQEPQNINPVCSCSGHPWNGTAPLTVQFTGRATDADGIITFYHWDFGDGSVADLQNPTHTFLHVGTYTVRFTVTDNNASTGKSSMQVSVHEPSNYPPRASITVDRSYGVSPLTVMFSGSGSDADGYITTYFWNFDDGSNSSQQNTSHTFTTIGIYNVSLQVTDDKQAIDIALVTIKCIPIHNLTQNGINYICQQYGDASYCIVSEGLIFNFTDDTSQTYSELPGGTTDILSFIMMGAVQSITMVVPKRQTILNPLQAFLAANEGLILDSYDVAFLLQHDETSDDQWCYTPAIL